MNAYKVVKDFERALCDYTGAPYCVTVNSCSMALFLCCKLLKVQEVIIPRFTYPSVAAGIVNAGGWCKFEDSNWQTLGWYKLKPTNIIDSAKYLAKLMYIKNTYTCLSFHAKKTIPIGQGGAILLDNKEHYELLKCMRFDGRHEKALCLDVLECVGWNCYLSSDRAARGLELMQWIKNENLLPPDPYQDLSRYDFYKRKSC